MNLQSRRLTPAPAFKQQFDLLELQVADIPSAVLSMPTLRHLTLCTFSLRRIRYRNAGASCSFPTLLTCVQTVDSRAKRVKGTYHRRRRCPRLAQHGAPMYRSVYHDRQNASANLSICRRPPSPSLCASGQRALAQDLSMRGRLSTVYLLDHNCCPSFVLPTTPGLLCTITTATA